MHTGIVFAVQDGIQIYTPRNKRQLVAGALVRSPPAHVCTLKPACWRYKTVTIIIIINRRTQYWKETNDDLIGFP